MSDLRYNLKANVKRYSKGKNKAEYVAKMAMYIALSFILYAFCKFHLSFIFPSFLEIQISELPALIAGFSMGPISGCLVIVFKCLLKFPLSSTLLVGESTDILLGICFVLPSSLIYNAKKNKKTAAIGLVVGGLLSTVAAIIVNRYISVPFYVEVMFGGNFDVLLNMVRPLYKNVTQASFYKWYLGLGILPFNLLRCLLVSLVTYLLYPRLEKPLRLETQPDVPAQNGGDKGSVNIEEGKGANEDVSSDNQAVANPVEEETATKTDGDSGDNSIAKS